MKRDYNQGIKAKTALSKVIRTLFKLPILKDCLNTKWNSCHAIAQHHNGAVRNDSILQLDPSTLIFSVLRVPLVYVMHIVGQSVQK